VETQYPTLEKVALTVVVMAQQLRYYFQNHEMRVMTDLPIKTGSAKTQYFGKVCKMDSRVITVWHPV